MNYYVLTENQNWKKRQMIEMFLFLLIYYFLVGTVSQRMIISSNKMLQIVSQQEQISSLQEKVMLQKGMESEEENMQSTREDFLSIQQAEAIQRGEYLYYPTEEEIAIMEVMIFLEAGNQKEEGMLLVGEVIRNRVLSEKFPNTIKEVCLQPGQFSSIKDNVIPSLSQVLTNEAKIEQIHNIALQVFKDSNIGEGLLQEEAKRLGITDETYWKDGVLGFCNPEAITNPEIKVKKEAITVQVRVGAHIFYRIEK